MEETKKHQPENNIAYIDGQNLYMGTNNIGTDSWKIDLRRFRVYLEKRYGAQVAYYYLGYVKEGDSIEGLYEEIQRAGFVLVFRQHNSAMIGKKKGNVDADIIFSVMKRLYKRESFDKVVLVSGDGDYKMMVDFLIEEGKFKKILFPNRRFASSLYKEIRTVFYDALDAPDIKRKIGRKNDRQKEKGSLGS